MNARKLTVLMLVTVLIARSLLAARRSACLRWRLASFSRSERNSLRSWSMKILDLTRSPMALVLTT